MRPRVTSMDAAQGKRNIKGSTRQDAPIYGRGTRGRAPGKGVMGSDIPTLSSCTTQADGNRKRAPVEGAEVSDIPSQ